MSAARSPYRRSDWYLGMRVDPHLDNILSELDVETHDKRRAKMAGAYAGKENPQLERDVDDQIASWVNLIKSQHISEGGALKPMDVTLQTQYFTLDVITSLAYGKAFGYLERNEDVYDYIALAEQFISTVAPIVGVAPIHKFLYRSGLIFKIAPSPEDTKGFGRLMAEARTAVGERFEQDAKEHQDMIGAFVRNGIPQKQIEAELLLQIIAGSDTTASAIRSTLLRLLTSPRVLAKLRAEVDAAVTEGRVSRPIQQKESRQLPYLQAVVKEGLRITPPFLGQVSKEVPAGGDTFDGIFLPGGTRIGHNVYALTRHPIFGADSDIFRPERWLEADPETRDEMEKTVDLVFGYGRWSCMGKNVAFLEMDKVYFEVWLFPFPVFVACLLTLLQLLRQFDFDVVNAEKPWSSKNFNIWMQHNFFVRVMLRDQSNKI